MKNVSELLIAGLLVAVIATACMSKATAKPIQSKDFSSLVSDDEYQSPTDCSVGINEANQEECSK